MNPNDQTNPSTTENANIQTNNTQVEMNPPVSPPQQTPSINQTSPQTSTTTVQGQQTAVPTQPVNIQTPTTNNTGQTQQPITQQIDPNAVNILEVNRQKKVKKANQVTFFILIVLEILLALRFLFKLIIAQTINPLINFIYNISSPFVYPFTGIFKDSGDPTQNLLEWNVLIAMAMYVLFSFIIIGLIKLFAPTAPQKVWEE